MIWKDVTPSQAVAVLHATVFVDRDGAQWCYVDCCGRMWRSAPMLDVGSRTSTRAAWVREVRAWAVDMRMEVHRVDLRFSTGEPIEVPS